MSERDLFADTVGSYESLRTEWSHVFRTQEWLAAEIEDGRVWFRRDYPHPDWTAYAIDTGTGSAVVLSVSTERRNVPLISVEAVFSRVEDAGKYIVATIGDLFRITARKNPIFWEWEDAGIAPNINITRVDDADLALCREISGVQHQPASQFFKRYSVNGLQEISGLISDANAPLSRVMLLSFDEINRTFSAGL